LARPPRFRPDAAVGSFSSFFLLCMCLICHPVYMSRSIAPAFVPGTSSLIVDQVAQPRPVAPPRFWHRIKGDGGVLGNAPPPHRLCDDHHPCGRDVFLRGVRLPCANVCEKRKRKEVFFYVPLPFSRLNPHRSPGLTPPHQQPPPHPPPPYPLSPHTTKAFSSLQKTSRT